MLRNLQSDMQSMNKRVSDLEEKQTQSLSYTSPKGKEATRGSCAGVTPATMQSITPASAKAQSASYASVTVQSATPAPGMAQSATPASDTAQNATPAAVTVQSTTPTPVMVQ